MPLPDTLQIVTRLQANPIIKYLVYYPVRFIALRTTHRARLREKKREMEWWRYRRAVTISCPDNARIPRVPDAGRVQGNILTMHNGLRVRKDSHYGADMLRLLRENRGVHEPQEELVFAEVLKWLPDEATMVELGSYWAVLLDVVSQCRSETTMRARRAHGGLS